MKKKRPRTKNEILRDILKNCLEPIAISRALSLANLHGHTWTKYRDIILQEGYVKRLPDLRIVITPKGKWFLRQMKENEG